MNPRSNEVLEQGGKPNLYTGSRNERQTRLMEAHIARLVAPRILVWDKEIVAPLNHGELLAETVVSAISPGTETAAFTGIAPLRPGPVYPRVVGYCNVARIISYAGRGDLQVGDLILTHQSHRSAFKCSTSDVLAVLSPAADASATSLTYLFRLARVALRRGGLKKGMTVSVVGLGTLGLATAILASESGRVIAYSDQKHMDLEILATSDVRQKSAVNDSEADLVVSTSNLWSDWDVALRSARAGATVAVLGFPGRGQGAGGYNPLRSDLFYDKQLTIAAAGNPGIGDDQAGRQILKDDMNDIAIGISSGAIRADRLIRATITPPELASTYERLASREAGLITAVIKW